jgi:hypothetical protein
MNIDVKILSKIILNSTEEHIKKMIHHDHMVFIPEILGWFNIHKSINMLYHINRRKHKNHPIDSVHAEKAFVKTQHLFFINS